MPLPRRALLGAGLAAATALVGGCGDGPDGRSGSGGPSATTTPPSPPAPGPSATPGPVLSAGPTPVGLTDRLTAALRRYLSPTPDNPRHPWFAGAVVLVSVGGVTRVHTAVGDALRYDAGPVELPPSRRVPMRPDSIFDLASLTKVYVAILAMQQVERGRIALDEPVVEVLPGFDGPGKAAVTVNMLLTHTSGLPVGASVAGGSTLAEKRAAVLATPLVAAAVPGTTFRYSSVGLMVLAQLVEQVTGLALDQALRSGVTGPLGLADTGFSPLRWLDATARASRLVATDARSSRGLLRGVVHDSVANQLGGIAGHAGIFGTAADVAVIGQALLNGGVYGGTRILAGSTVGQMLANANRGLPAIDPDRPGRPSDHGLGVVLNQPWFMGRLATPGTFGHTGFTGTSLLVDP
ncbi:MAG TPA: serine hydrolase domain-containing protein, partial [Micromonosporaceae bacterium]